MFYNIFVIVFLSEGRVGVLHQEILKNNNKEVRSRKSGVMPKQPQGRTYSLSFIVVSNHYVYPLKKF